MEALLSHKTALEYWRLVGLHGVVTPQKSNKQKAPKRFDTETIGYFANMGVVSLPLHGTTSSKYKPTDISICHYRPTNYPKGALYKVQDNLLITSPELTLVEMAADLSLPETAALISEFCGLYSPAEEAEHGMFSREPLTTLDKLAAFLETCEGTRGLTNAKAALKFAFENSRSPMETAAALIFSLKPLRGGYSLGKPEVNMRVALGAKTRKGAGVDTLMPDLLWPDAKVCVEYDSTEFHSSDERANIDSQRKNALQAAGYQVVTLTSQQLYDVAQTDVVAKQIAALLGRRATMPKPLAQAQLREELLGSNSILKG